MFESVITNRWFLNSAIILFMNKKDIFRKKIVTCPIELSFPDYTGGADILKARNFILGKFLQKAANKKSGIFTFFTCATDTKNITRVMNAVNESILQNVLKSVSL